MTRRIIVRKFDPIRPVYAAKPFIANGREYEIGEELAWRKLEVDKHRVRRMYDSGLLVHGDERPRQEMVREKNLNTSQNHDKESTSAKTSANDFPRHTGGPWYELSNGEKIKGKEAAELAEAEL